MQLEQVLALVPLKIEKNDTGQSWNSLNINSDYLDAIMNNILKQVTKCLLYNNGILEPLFKYILY